MKELFRGYYSISEDELKEIWQKGFITFDTNVLFNLYRYSDETRKELLKIIKKYSPQIFLSYHTAYEYHKNRITVISEQIAIYDETLKLFQKLENDIVKNLKTPHLEKRTLQNFKKSLVEVEKDLDSKKKFFLDLLKNDTILASITKIFKEKKIGVAFSTKEIAEIEKEGNDRYAQKVPPGYKDNEKKINKFGDLIIWKELLKHSKEKEKPFLFIMDDVKEDWWLRTNGQTLSPRPELLQEVYGECRQLFYLYTTDRFLEFASKSDEIPQNTIDEVRQLNTWKSIKQTPTLTETLERLKKNESNMKLLETLKKFHEANESFRLFNSVSTDNQLYSKFYRNLIENQEKRMNKNYDDTENDDENPSISDQ